MANILFSRILAVAMLTSIATFAFAEDAPVYDADSYPPQFDGQSDTGGAPPPMSEPDQTGTSSEHAAQPISPASSFPLTTDQRLRQLEQQMVNLQHAEASAKMNTLQAELQTLRGQVEEMAHQLQQMQVQQRTLYADLDKRINQLSTTTPPASPVSVNHDASVTEKPSVKSKKLPVKATVPDTSSTKNATAPVPTAATNVATAAQPNVAEEQDIYQTAYDFIKAKKYDEAIAALQKMLQKYPSGQFAANAHYWLGELYNLVGKYDASAVEFATVIGSYPDSPKVSDAQLKLGMIYATQFKWTDAKAAFKKVINHYPGTASARLATEQLKQIKQAGH